MKVCPVCNESFADELKFCDVDGARLTRQRDVTAPQRENKGWSMLGVALLVGALVISAITIIFLPRARVSPPVVNSEPQASPSNKAATTETASNAADTAAADQPEIIVTEGPAPDLKKKDKAKALASENSNESTLNPKAAAQSGEETERTAQPIEATPPPAAPRKIEPVPVSRTVNDPRETEAATKPAQTSADLKKNQPAGSKDSSKDADSKKKKDEKEKKGGFFRVFKKIFGKD